MTEFNQARRVRLIARALRLIAAGLEEAKDGGQLFRMLRALQSSVNLVMLCCYHCQKTLIENAKHDIDSKEAA